MLTSRCLIYIAKYPAAHKNVNCCDLSLVQHTKYYFSTIFSHRIKQPHRLRVHSILRRVAAWDIAKICVDSRKLKQKCSKSLTTLKTAKKRSFTQTDITAILILINSRPFMAVAFSKSISTVHNMNDWMLRPTLTWQRNKKTCNCELNIHKKKQNVLSLGNFFNWPVSSLPKWNRYWREGYKYSVAHWFYHNHMWTMNTKQNRFELLFFVVVVLFCLWMNPTQTYRSINRGNKLVKQDFCVC